MTIELITAQTVWAVTLANVKQHLTGTNNNDTYIQQLIYAAQSKVEQEYDLRLNEATYEMKLDKFPSKEIEIWLWPIKTLSSVKYIDTAGVTQTVTSTNYSTDLLSKPARIMPIGGYSWPDTKTVLNAVQVRFVTGFTSPATCPDDIEHALYLIITDWYDNREDKGYRFNRIADRILSKYRFR